ncbi:MAG: hypothetical protein J5956_06410 [Ruminococcus sp.]|nr:hypothetical protein [Ruminococcus sp.]
MNRRRNIRRTISFMLVVLMLAGLVYWLVFTGGRQRAVAGLGEPVQTQTTGGTRKKVDGFTVDITYKYEYEIEALVVHTKHYDGSSLADELAPVDLALAWGTVAEHNEEIDFNWEQRGRWYYWSVNDASDLAPVGGTAGVNRQSANNHILPAFSRVKETVLDIKTGDRIKLKGYLVNINALKSNGESFTWVSSTTREDTGDGACEVFYVTQAEIIDRA